MSITTNTLSYLASQHNVSEDTVQKLWDEFEAHHEKLKFQNRFGELGKLNAMLRDRIQEREVIIANTLRKFPHVLRSKLNIVHLNNLNTVAGITREGKFISISSLGEDFVLQRSDVVEFYYQKPGYSYTSHIGVPAKQLWNDPVAVAQYTRKAVRAAQKAERDELKRTANNTRVQLNSKLRSIQREIDAHEKATKGLENDGKKKWELRLEHLGAAEKLGSTAFRSLKKLIQAAEDNKWGVPGLFQGAEGDNNIRAEWLRQGEAVVTVEISPEGVFDLFCLQREEGSDDKVSSLETSKFLDAYSFLEDCFSKKLK